MVLQSSGVPISVSDIQTEFGLKSGANFVEKSLKANLLPLIGSGNSVSMSTFYGKSGFKPTGITGLVLWLDASDPNNDGTLPANNSSLKKWTDKSGNNKHGASTSGVTWYSSQLNSLPTFYFPTTANDISLFFSGSISITTSSLTIFAIAYIPNSSVPFAGRIIGLSASGANDYDNNSYLGFLRQSGTGFQPYRGNTTITNNPQNYNEPYLTECWFDGTNMYATVQKGDTTAINSTGKTGSFNISFYCIGNQANVSDYNAQLGGYISEIIIFNNSLTDVNRSKMEGYLSWKWGLQGKLPSTHTYKNSKP